MVRGTEALTLLRRARFASPTDPGSPSRLPRAAFPLGLSVLLAGVLPSGGGAVPAAAGPDERLPHERIDLPSAEACGGCHARELAEWSGSLHGRAWTNANIRAATSDFAKVECRACHSPLPVLPVGLDEPPDYRDFNQADGVHCLACHGLSDGVAAARSSDAPCRPRAEPRLFSADMCWPCHEPTHHAFQEYRVSQAFAAGKRCQDCHMPPREEGGGHFHGARGGFNEAFVKSAVGWEASLQDGEVVLTLQNRTGHKFPGEISSRSFLVRVSFPQKEPVDLLLSKPHKGEERVDDRLTPDERRVLRFPLPEGVRSAHLELFFLPLPLLPPEQGFLIGEWSSE
jgi:hypothetical protein